MTGVQTCALPIFSKDYMEKVDRILKRIIDHRKGKTFSDYKIRNVDFSNLASEIETIRKLYNPIWNEGNHPQQVKMTDAEFDVLALGLKELSMVELGITRGSASQLADINMDIINPIFRLGKTSLTWRVYGLNI